MASLNMKFSHLDQNSVLAPSGFMSWLRNYEEEQSHAKTSISDYRAFCVHNVLYSSPTSSCHKNWSHYSEGNITQEIWLLSINKRVSEKISSWVITGRNHCLHASINFQESSKCWAFIKYAYATKNVNPYLSDLSHRIVNKAFSPRSIMER